ncbi:MAG TPA: hypothetical protein VFV65_08950 [Gemmatimonadales bacterium]|nr:hypothetical protein [Gemmatimonadales bacterium]
MNTASKLSLAVVTLLAIGASSAQAQSATISATATVLTPLTLTGAAPLAFGSVYPGVAKTIAPGDATSGRFTFAGAAAAQVSFNFPSNPVNLTGAGTLPIGTYTGLHNTTNTTTGATAFTPGVTAVLANLSGTGALFLFIGATVSPTPTQTAGAYTGTITLNAVYTGS